MLVRFFNFFNLFMYIMITLYSKITRCSDYTLNTYIYESPACLQCSLLVNLFFFFFLNQFLIGFFESSLDYRSKASWDDKEIQNVCAMPLSAAIYIYNEIHHCLISWEKWGYWSQSSPIPAVWDWDTCHLRQIHHFVI